MDKTPLFSVIIPIYNVENYIIKCVDSVLNQTFSDYEVILVDDGSPDNCPQICDTLQKQDNRIKVIHKSNEGVSHARKDGADCAIGRYLIFVDGDDLIASDCLDSISRVIEDTGVDVVCHATFYDNGEQMKPVKLPFRGGYYSKEDMKKEIFPYLIQKEDASYFQPSLWGKAFKREIFIKNVFTNEKATIGEDVACTIPCLYNSSSMYILNECLYFYRYNVQSATKSKKVYNWDWPKITAEHIKNKVDINYSDFEKQLNRKIAHDVFNVIVSQFNRDEPYSVIIKEIKSNLDDEFYSNAIQHCRFRKSIKAIVMQFVLKRRIFFPIYLYAKI
ncbi:glycosyltransferase family 2 protein [Longibaculum muris]|uniref:glycosyltransferase family 2 protein n=1 Tax=Longibaculum muris TaxID=1796628 RepID=UPI0012B96C50|nr:glycosyltransferase family 2 protein [Longibaculum muris]